MGRTPRWNIEGGTYHVMNRGNRKQRIFEDDRDRRTFLRILIDEQEVHGVKLLGRCEIDNHFHQVVVTPRGNLSAFMERFEGTFARYSNARHRNVGHLFQGRFRGVVIEHDIHLLTALCYVFLNPVSARLVARPEEYRWSSYAATIGLRPTPKYLQIDWLTDLFPDTSLAESQRCFRTLMTEARPTAAYLEADVDRNTVRRVLHSYVGEQLQLGNLPRLYRSALRAPLSELVHQNMSASSLAAAIHDARVIEGYRLAQIARELRMHPNVVSKIFRSIRKSSDSSDR